MILPQPPSGRRWALCVVFLALVLLGACRDEAERAQATQSPVAPLERLAYDGPPPPNAGARLGRGELATLQISPDGRYLVAGGEIGLFLYDAHTLADVWQLDSASPVTSAAFSPGGRLLATGQADGSLELVDVAKGEVAGRLPAAGGGDSSLSGMAWTERPGAAGELLLAAGFSDGNVLMNLVQEQGPVAGELTLKILGQLERQPGGVTALAFDPSGSVLASGNRQGTIRLNDSQTLTGLGLLEGHEKNHHPLALAWSPDGRRLVSIANDGQLIVWNVATMQPALTYSREDEQPLDIRFAAGGDGLVSLWQDGAQALWSDRELAEGPQVVEGQQALVAGRLAPDGPGWIGLLPDGRLVQVGDDGPERFVVGHAPANTLATAVAWSPDGRRLATALGEKILLWDAAGRQPEATLAGHTGRIVALAWSPDGQTLASAGGDGRIILWDVAAASQRRQLTGHQAIVAALAWSPDGRILASAGSLDQSVILWDAATGELGQRLTARTGLWSLAWSPDGRTLATGTALGEVLLWDVSQVEARQTDIIRRHLDWVSGLAWSPDGQLLASVSGDALLVLLDLASGETRTYLGHQAPVLDVAFSHDGLRLATAGRDEKVIIWDAGRQASTTPLRLLEGHNDGVRALAWSADDRWLATAADDGTVILWDAAASGN